MSQFVLPLDKIQPRAAAITGNKAANLAQLMHAGFPVPQGICITTLAFFAAITDYHDQIQAVTAQYDLRQITDATSASQIIMNILTGLTVPQMIIRILNEEYSSLLANTLAVRSSATAEDQPDLSYAGQYDTVLGVTGESAVVDAIVACWKSFYAPNALIMRATHCVPEANQGMAVIIQPFIHAECAGVCFSVDPVHRQRDTVVISAAWGLGTGIVDGSVASDTYRLRRGDFAIMQRDIQVKPERIGTQLQSEPVPVDWQSVACLPDEWAQRLAQFTIAAELSFGSPQDVEWAIVDEQIWILQSRPVTALASELAKPRPFPVDWSDDRHRYTLWRCATDKAVPLLPLEQADLQITEDMRDEACRFMGADRNQEIRFINGRAYVRPLPPSFTPADMRIRRQAQQDLRDRLHQQGLTSWDYWGPEIVMATNRLRAFDATTADDEALASHLEDAIAVRRRHYMLHPLSWFDPHPAYFAAIEAVAGVTGDEARSLGYQLLEVPATPLTQLVDALYQLVEVARNEPPVMSLILSSPVDVMSQLKELPTATIFMEHLNALLGRYGERTGNGWGSETSVATPTWQEQPEQVLQLSAAYLNTDGIPPAVARMKAYADCDARFEALCATCPDLQAVATLRRERTYAQKCMSVLEIHNHYIDQMAIGQLRLAVMASAYRLVKKGHLKQTDDILWLDFAEILAALREQSPDSCAEVIAERQAKHQQWHELEAPPILGIPARTLPPRVQSTVASATQQSTTDGVLSGLGASYGLGEGIAFVIMDENMALPDITAGTILVAPNIGPRWTPLFPLLGGLVLDDGAIGQHAATTAREYGIPAIVGTKVATSRIRTGEWVRVNGTTGQVQYSPPDE